MPRPLCAICRSANASLRRPRNGMMMCTACFFDAFEAEVHRCITDQHLFSPGDIVACGASGGKDSTVLMHLMKLLNERHQYGLDLRLVSIDEGIQGYRDDSLLTVHRNSSHYGLPLTILSYKDLYGWTMDEIVSVIGSKNNCTFCGVFRRQALERGAMLIGANKIVTGHNADDTAETILMNILRSDAARLARCGGTATDTINNTQHQQRNNSNVSNDDDGEGGGGGPSGIPRVKPLKYAYEKEIVLYAHFKKLDYFTTECTYSKEAFRGCARTLVKDLEAADPRTIANIVFSGETLPPPMPTAAAASHAGPSSSTTTSCAASSAVGVPSSLSTTAGCCGGVAVAASTPTSTGAETSGRIEPSPAPSAAASTVSAAQRRCVRCGFVTSQDLCRACVLLEALNAGRARLALRETGGAIAGGLKV